MKINKKKCTMIRPVEDLPNRRLWLSNLDLMHERNHVPTLYFYKLNDGFMPFDACKVLKKAMSKVLVPFYPVAGRLGRDERGRLEINCNGEGVLFIEAEADFAIDELGDLMLKVKTQQLIPSIDYSNGISSLPLLVIQVTSFTCGRVSLGIRMSHVLTDGTGALYFIKTWCDVAHNLPIKVLPLMDRTILQSQASPNPNFQHIELESLLRNTSIIHLDFTKTNTITKVFKITTEQLHTLKTKVNDKNSKTKYSSYQILTAHIWHCTCKARGLSGEQTTKLCLAVDGRSRLQPPLPPNFFGNATFGTMSIALCKDLLSETLTDIAERINKATKRMDNEYLRSAINYLEPMHDNGMKVFLVNPQTYWCPNLGVASWMWLPFYDLDFGMGKPIYVTTENPNEGKGFILSTPNNDGSWALIICLETNHMQSFQKLFYDF